MGAVYTQMYKNWKCCSCHAKPVVAGVVWRVPAGLGVVATNLWFVDESLLNLNTIDWPTTYFWLLCQNSDLNLSFHILEFY